MTDEFDYELRQLRQEREIYRLRADLQKALRRCDKLQKMHDDDQKYIQTLQRKLKRDRAEDIFGDG